MSGGFPTQNALGLAQHRQDVAIAHRGAAKLNVGRTQRHLKSQVAHHRADHRPPQRSCLLERTRHDVQKLIAVHDAAEMIGHDEPVTVAIERDANVRAYTRHRELQKIRRGRTAAVVDIATVRRAADRHDLCAQVGENPRRYLVGGAVGAVDHDLQTRQVHARRQRRGTEFLVEEARAVRTRRTSEAA